MDSGANGCITGDLSLFAGAVIPVDVSVEGIHGGLRATGVGTAVVPVAGYNLHIQNMFYVPGFARTIISVGVLVDDGFTVAFSKYFSGDLHGTNAAKVSYGQRGQFCFKLVGNNKLYEWGSSASAVRCAAARVSSKNVERNNNNNIRKPILAGKGLRDARGEFLTFQELVHRRLSHVSLGSRHLARALEEAVPGVRFSPDHMAFCEACVLAKLKAHRSRRPARRRATRPLQRVHFDLAFAGIPGFAGQVGFLIMVDEYTEKVFVRLIWKKSETARILSEFKAQVEAHFQELMGDVSSPFRPFRLSGLRSDSAAENMGGEIREWCKKSGIFHEFSAPYCQWQNGRAERLIGVLWNGSEAARKAAGAPGRYWPLSLLNFVFVHNNLPTKSSSRSPNERWWNVTVPLRDRLERIRCWGSLAYLHVPKALRRKGDDHARRCVLVGHSDVTNGYLLLCLDTGQFLTGHSVVCDEGRFPFRESPEDFGYDYVDVDLHVDLYAESSPDASPPPSSDSSAAPVVFGDFPPVGSVPSSSNSVSPVLFGDFPLAGSSDSTAPVASSSVSDTGAADAEVISAAFSPVSASDGQGQSSSFSPAPVASSASGEVDASSPPALQYTVQRIAGYRVGKAFDDAGVELPYLVEQYRVKWKNYSEAESTWEDADNVDAPELVHHFLSTKSGKEAFKKQRARFAGRIRGVDYVSSSATSELPAAGSGATSSLGSPPVESLQPESPAVDGLAESTSSPVLAESMSPPAVPSVQLAGEVVQAPLSVSTLRVRLNEVQCHLRAGSSCRADAVSVSRLDGAPLVPSVCAEAQVAARVGIRLASKPCSEHDLRRISNRIRLLELASRSPPPALRVASTVVRDFIPGTIDEALSDINSSRGGVLSSMKLSRVKISGRGSLYILHRGLISWAVDGSSR